ncbi:MAG: DUF4340 domain-containing protein [Deltaproteobacteria bacterium]|nr:DUF4340 domain-containing protein [Deltaproteobacteria bacterium]
MKNRTTIIILAVAVILVAFIYFFERDTMTTSEREERKGRVFTSLRRDHVDGLSIRGTGGQEVVLKQIAAPDLEGEEQWKITSPRKLDADDSEVRAVLSALDFLLANRRIEGSKRREEDQYGLGSPRLKASFTIRGEKTSFGIGADAQGKKVYLGIDGENEVFYAVDSDFLESMDKSLNDLRSKKLVSSDIAEPNAVELSLEEGTTKLRLEKSGSWQVETGGHWILAAEDQVSELVRAVSDMKAEEFVADDVKEEDLKKYGLADGARAISLQLPGDEKVTVRIGDKCKDKKHRLYLTAVGTGTVICATDGFMPVLERPATRLWEMRPAVFREEDVTRISLASGTSTLVLEKGEDQWKFADKDDTPIEQNAVTDLLGALKEIRASSIEVGDAATTSLAEPTAKVTLALAGDEAGIELHLFGEPGGDTEKLRRSGEPAVLTFPKGLIKQARPDALAFRDRQITNGDKNDVEALSINGAVSQKVEKKDGAWKVIEPVQIAADGTASRKLAELVADLKVARFASAKALPEQGFAKPFATVTARFTEEKESEEVVDRTGSFEVTLEIGAVAGEGERFGRLRGEDPTIFVLGPEYEEAVSRPLVARDLLQIDDTEIVKLVLVVDEKEFVFEREKETWQAKTGTLSDTENLKRLVADLGGIKAIRAASFGPAGSEFLAPSLVVKSFRGEQKEKGEATVITIGQKSADEKEDGYFARRGDLNVTFVLPARIVDELIALARGGVSDAGVN